jgi:hypothetical protein
MKIVTKTTRQLAGFLAVLCLIFTLPLFGQPFTRSIVADSVLNNAPVYYGHERNTARATDGTLLVAWQDVAGSGGQVVSSTYDDIFQIWSTPVNVSFAGDEAEKVGLIADGQGRIHAAWQQRTTSGSKWEIHHAIYSSGSWSTPNPVSQDPNLDAEECAIEVDSNSDIVVVWNTDAEPDGSEWILLSRSSNNGASWSIPDTLSSPDGIINGGQTSSARVSLWAGSNGKLVAVWHEEYPGREREIYYNEYDGSSWSGEMVVSDTTAIVERNWYPNVAMDSQDNVYVVYVADINGPGLRHVLLAGKPWGGQFALPYDTVYSDSSDFLTQAITVDENDGLYVGFRRPIPGDTLSLEEVAYRVSRDAGASWSNIYTLSRTNHDAGYLTFVGHVNGAVNATWRESFHELIDDESVTTVLHADDIITGIKDQMNNLPSAFILKQNYPNPFNPATTIDYAVFQAGEYELAVYNLLGQKIRTLLSSRLNAGDYRAQWDGRNEAGQKVGSGIYFYRLSGPNLTLTRKMVLMR